jgi:ribose transport system permease protein
MKKFVGIVLFLLVVYGFLLVADPGARTLLNHFNLARRIGLYGIISLGAGMLIITGGIDLSIGSVVGFCATLFAMLLRVPFFEQAPILAILIVLLVGAWIGLANGVLVTQVRVQAFVVTLCGLFIYRGAARWLAGDSVKGLGNSCGPLKEALYSSTTLLGIDIWAPRSLLIFLLLAAVAIVFLHFSVYGRYFYAIGSNEKAASYSGIATSRYKILAYVLCSTMAAVYGMLLLMQENSAQPSSTGSFLELYAIAGAVLGGCSLRGGEGSVAGIVIGTSILVLLPNMSNMWGISSELDFTVIGGALLAGAILDEVLRRFGASAR